MTVKCSHNALDIERRKPQIVEHGCKRALTAKPNPFESVPRSGWIVFSELLYKSLDQGFTLSVAIAAKSEQKCLVACPIFCTK